MMMVALTSQQTETGPGESLGGWRGGHRCRRRERRARAELEETLAMMLEIEKEGLNFARSEADRRHYLLRRRKGLVRRLSNE